MHNSVKTGFYLLKNYTIVKQTATKLHKSPAERDRALFRLLSGLVRLNISVNRAGALTVIGQLGVCVQIQTQSLREGRHLSDRDTSAAVAQSACSAPNSSINTEHRTDTDRHGSLAKTSESRPVPRPVNQIPDGARHTSNRAGSTVQKSTSNSILHATEADRRNVTGTGAVTEPSLHNTRSKSSSNGPTCAAERGDKSSSANTSRDTAPNMTDTHATVAPSSSLSANAGINSSPGKPAQPRKPYVYTVIKDIKPGTSVNVFGVIKFVRPACIGRGVGEPVEIFH